MMLDKLFYILTELFDLTRIQDDLPRVASGYRKSQII